MAPAGRGHIPNPAFGLRKVLGPLAATGTRNGQSYIRAWRALALAHQGRYDEARKQAETGRRPSRGTNVSMRVPWDALAWGMIELLDPDAVPGAAEQWFQTALSEAHS